MMQMKILLLDTQNMASLSNWHLFIGFGALLEASFYPVRKWGVGLEDEHL